jgi:predicted ATPase/DNA-binding SARP family transcriptional activator
MTSATTRFRVLGPLEAHVGATPAALGGSKQRALLATLLLRRNEVVSRDRLIEVLWGDDPPASAAGSLQVYVHALRRELGTTRIETHGLGYCIRLGPGELDLDTFERLLGRARRALADQHPSDAEADLRAALALVEGDPLADLAGAEGLAADARRLEELRLEAIELRNDAELELGRHAALAADLQTLVAEFPFRERLRAQQMLALYRAGRQKEALECYRAARDTLVEELGVEPGLELQELERAILQQDPALKAPIVHRRLGGRLPAVPTPLIGRDLEIAAVTALLGRDEVRQVTLTGPGGSGKTRLALAVAAELAPQLRDGCVFVDLSSVADPALFAPTLAQALGVQESETPLSDAIGEDLRGRAGLLVLDNFEQLLPEATRIAEFLTDSRHLQMIVTSRVPLRLSWEHEYPVPPLAFPDEEKAEFAALAATDAVRLFTARAMAVNPQFELTAESAGSVAEICRRLDGLPLAIELAAARSKLVPPRTMVEQLDRLIPLLTGGAVDLPARHRTIEATLDWSYALLDAQERTMFERLAVFRGGWTVDAAAAICADEVDDVLAPISVLLDHSLVRRIPAGRSPRFNMLETIREYALGRLAARHDEEASTRLRHAEYFTSLAVTAEEAFLAGADVAPVLTQLAQEHDNLRGALEYLHERGDSELALRLASALVFFWRVRGHLSEGRMWLEGALSSADGVPPTLLAKAFSGAGRLAYRQGDTGRARELHEQALNISRSTGSLRELGQALSDLGGVSLAENELDRAESLYTESAEVLREAEHHVRLGTVLSNLATIRLARQDSAGARSLARDALALQLATGDKEGRVSTYLVLARAAISQSRDAEAQDALHNGRALIEELDYREVVGYWLLTCAELACKRGDCARAALLLGAADAQFERLGVSQLQADDLAVRDTITGAALAQLGSQAYEAALAAGREASTDDLVARALAPGN